MITRQMNPFFYKLFELYTLIYFISAYQDFQYSVPWGHVFALYSGLQNIYFQAKDGNFKSVNIELLFYVKFRTFCYLICFVLNLIPIWPRCRGLIFNMVSMSDCM